MAFQVEPLASESSPKRPWAQRPPLSPSWQREGVWETEPGTSSKGHTGLSAFGLTADQPGGDSGALQG